MNRSNAVKAVMVVVTALTAAWPVGAAASPAPAGGTGTWPMYADGPAHNGDDRAETSLSPTTVGGLHITHTYSALETIGGPDGPYQVIVGSLGYSVVQGPGAGSTGYIEAFHLPSGTQAWRHLVYTHNASWNYVPAVSNGDLFIGGESAVYALNATNGHLLWQTSIASEESDATTVATNGTVLVESYAGNTIYALNRSTGAILWSVVPPGCCLAGAVSTSGSLAYVTTNNEFIAYRLSTGALVFNVAAAGDAETPAIAVTGGRAFVQSVNDLQAFNATTGALLWTSATMPGDVESSLTPADDGNTVVVGTPQYLIAFNAATGARRWTIDGGSVSDYLTPSIANGVVYAGSIGHGLQAVNEATGAVLFAGGALCWSAIVSQGSVYATCSLGETVFSL